MPTLTRSPYRRLLTRRIVRSLALGHLVLLLGCSQQEKVSATQTSEPVASVPVALVRRTDLAQEFEVAAEFKPYQEVDLHAKVAGYLKRITVDVGDRVQQGQLLATLEVPEMRQELLLAGALEARTQLDVARAEAELKRAETARRIHLLSFERLSGVAKTRPNLIAQQEIDNAEAKLRDAEAQITTAQAALAAMKEQVSVSTASKARVGTMLDYLSISAPFSGVITKRYADPGAMIQAGTASQSQAMPVVRLSQIDRLRLVLPVPESMVPRVKVGSSVEVRVDTLSRVFQGKVTRFTGRLESATRTMETEVDVANPSGVLMPGMYAYASLQVDGRQDAISIPIQAAGTGAVPGGSASLLIVDPNQTVAQREVRFGLVTPDFVEVTSGLQEGDLLIMSSAKLRPGQRVAPKITSLAQGAH